MLAEELPDWPFAVQRSSDREHIFPEEDSQLRKLPVQERTLEIYVYKIRIRPSGW